MSQIPPPDSKPTLDYAGNYGSKYAACPQCGSYGSQPVGWTIWGGMLGPKMLTHVRCPSCKTAYNGKTGKSNTPAITIYVIVSTAIAIALVVLIRTR